MSWSLQKKVLIQENVTAGTISRVSKYLGFVNTLSEAAEGNNFQT
jgi:hypothetical protein